MKSNKTYRLIIITILTISALISCSEDNITKNTIEIGTDVVQYTETIASAISHKYEQIHFGETQDVLLLDVEWHTPESYEEQQLKYYGNFGDSEEEAARETRTMEQINFFKDVIKNKETYIMKTANGIDSHELFLLDFDIFAQNPNNNRTAGDLDFDTQIDPDGCFAYNIYPFTAKVWYQDEEDHWHTKEFNAHNEKEFALVLDELTAYCDDLLANGLLSQEEYDMYAISSPLDYFVRVLGLFGEEDLKNYPSKEIIIPATPVLDKGKREYEILFVGNSLTYVESLPEQLADIAGMYGVTVNHTSVTNPGVLTKYTKDKAIENIRDNKYDYVVFQDGAMLPVGEQKAYWTDVERFSEEAAKSGAVLLVYSPSAMMNEPSFMGLYEGNRGYQSRLTESCENAARVHGAVVINAAEAWIYAYDRHPDLSLYASKTDSHPNKAGAYLTACVFASTLFDMHVRDVSEDNFYHGDDAIRLGQAAWEYVQYYNEHKTFPEEAVVVLDGTNKRAIADK